MLSFSKNTEISSKKQMKNFRITLTCYSHGAPAYNTGLSWKHIIIGAVENYAHYNNHSLSDSFLVEICGW